MTQEDKELLLKDLCARLPYGVKVDIPSDYPFTPPILEGIRHDGEIIVDKIRAYDFGYYKPYLRRESSMADEERESFHKLMVYNHNDCKDWYNSHHIDDRGLIDKGLAIEVTEENNPYK